ncbi:MAG TPA: glycosyltransferase family A protein, partial [Longimicrobiaceae bacterium]
MSRPLVSVVMPCYNAAPFVAEAMESVLAQAYAPLELVVVDDASTDGSREAVSAVAERHPDRVRTLWMERNRGGCHARNRGGEAARGGFLMFLDADDAIRPDTVAALVEAVRDRPDGIAACPWRHLEKVGGEWRETPASLPLPEAGADLFRVWLEGSAWAPTSSVLWRRDVYERVGGWDEELAREQDDDIMLRAYALGSRLVIADGGLAYYRFHETLTLSVTRGVAEDKLRSSVRVVEKLAAEVERAGR